MLSAYPPFQTTDGFLGNHLPVFESGFPSWDSFDNFSYFPQLEPDIISIEPVYSNSLLGHLSPKAEPVLSNETRKINDDISSSPEDVSNEPVLSNPGSDTLNPSPEPILEPIRKRAKNSSSSSDDVEPDLEGNLVIDERKRRRMVSNRESARRSRMRKQKHLENLRNQSNQLRVENRELTNQLRFATNHLQVVRTDNDRLRNEEVILRHRLWAAQQVLMVHELQNRTPHASIMTPINQQILL